MKRMTKVWGMLCLAGLLISLYLGVSFLVPKQGKIVLTFGMFSGNQSDVPNDDCYKIIDETIKEFEKEYPNVKVKYTSGILKEDYSEWLSNQALNGTLPDVFMVLPEDFTTFASIGILKNLETMLKADASLKKDAFYQGCYDAGTYKGNQYALPYESVPSLMLVNETLLKKNNISLPDNRWTWNDFYNICKKITKDTNDDGKTDQFGVYDYSWIDAIYSNGGGIFNGSGTSCNITNPSVEDAILLPEIFISYQGDKVRLQKILIKGILLSVQLLFLNFVHINHIRGGSINILILNGIVFHFQKDRMVKICQKQRQC
ncbi:extracellular solute-binding protein [Anaerobutyricum hallii]|nr:extracellular solute-binding protein [Anaerobutyricum hallii]